MAEEFLDGTEVGAIGEEMRGEGVAEGVRVEVPVYVDQADIFFDDAAYGALCEAAARVVEEDGFGVRRVAVAAAGAGGLEQQLFAERPVFFEGFLGFGAVGDDAFLVAFAADAQDAFFLIHVSEVEAGEFADADAGGVEEFEEGAVTAKEEAFIGRLGRIGGRAAGFAAWARFDAVGSRA